MAHWLTMWGIKQHEANIAFVRLHHPKRWKVVFQELCWPCGLGLSQGCITSWFPLLTERLWSEVRFFFAKSGSKKKGKHVFFDIVCRFNANLNPAGWIFQKLSRHMIHQECRFHGKNPTAQQNSCCIQIFGEATKARLRALWLLVGSQVWAV